MDVYIVGGGLCYHEDYEIEAIFLNISHARAFLRKCASERRLKKDPERDDYYSKGFEYVILSSHAVMDADNGQGE
jgi:hypothetical protein